MNDYQEKIKYLEDTISYLMDRHSKVYAENPEDEKLLAIESELEYARFQLSMYRDLANGGA